jgi:phenol 2-monooxygenase
VLCVTDFPDIRFKSVIRSSDEGTILIIPREGGYLVRLYIELERLNPDERVHEKNLTADHLIAAAQRIFRPFTFEVKEIAWWSVYEIGQRYAKRFTDTDAPRVFIAGDACHTHSPKAGQGMNVSMADTFNLGWKLAAVLRGQARPELLKTYESERRGVAQDLIAFDREFAKRISAGGDFAQHFTAQGRYTAGVAVRYETSMIQGAATHQDLATGFEIGTRFHSAPVLRLGDGKAMHLGHVAGIDGRWLLFVFVGQDGFDGVADALGRVQRDLAGENTDPDSVLDLRFILQDRPKDVPNHPVLFPRKGRLGLCDYEKVFAPDPKSGDIFDMRGVDRKRGALVLVRPDQYVAHVLPTDGIDMVEAFLKGIFLRD